MIRILIADDHAVVREGLQALIKTEPGMVVVATASDGVEAVVAARREKPDVILLDLQMPRKTGLEAIVDIKKEQPEARILVLTSFSDDETVFAAVQNGAMGYLLKDATPEELLTAVRHLSQGRSSLHPDIALKLIQQINKPKAQERLTEEPLTAREVTILQLVARGLSNVAIADELVVSERTVRTHISNILHKLHLANRTQAALYALRQGLASLDD
ncbi:MAG TPA: response regulator transcription factor [Anaerolineae bacterium]|nr:response regulator transcription factor [Anaerolineae bacterium]